MTTDLIAISISHRWAPVEVRERVQLTEDEARALVSDLRERDRMDALVLSTCNRTEIYVLPAELQSRSELSVAETLIDIALGKKELPEHESGTYKSYFEKLQSRDAITHLFSVI